MPVYEAKEWTQLWYDEATDPTTPRVMLIGDSITVGYTHTLNRHLEGMVRADSLGGSKGLDHPFYNEEIDLFARQFGFDYRLIHFNNGLHRMGMDAETYGALYEEKVQWLLARYPKAILTLATSTSVVPSPSQSSVEKTNAIICARNEKVWQIAQKYHLPVDDLYTAMLDHPEWHVPDGCHFTEEAKDIQGRLIAGFIRKQLNL